MATNPSNALIARFDNEDGASVALSELKEAKKRSSLGVHNAAVLKVGDDGKLRIKETADMSGGKGVVVGGVVGGVIGLFGSTLLLPIGLGAAIVGLGAKLRDSGFPNKSLSELGASLQPGMSLLVIAVDEAAVSPTGEILRRNGASVVQEAVDGQIAEELETAASAEAPATA